MLGPSLSLMYDQPATFKEKTKLLTMIGLAPKRAAYCITFKPCSSKQNIPENPILLTPL